MDKEDKDMAIPEAPAAQERMPDSDLLALERANTKRQLSLSDAKNSTLAAEAADMAYKNLVLQLFLKHGLTAEDTITVDGTINRKVKA